MIPYQLRRAIERVVQRMIGAFSNNETRWAIDASSGTGTTVAQDATYTPFSNAANFAGMFIVHDVTLGALGVFIQAGGSVISLGDTGQFTTTADSANKINVYLVTNIVTIQNKGTGAHQIRTWAIRTQSSA